jgi:hypothetical protein
VFQRLEQLARSCRAQFGSLGVWIEDKNSGTILLQQALRRQWPARAIEPQLTAMGKDECAISVSGYVYRGEVKYTDHAFNKTVIYKSKARNHVVEQVENFRVGDKDNKRVSDDFTRGQLDFDNCFVIIGQLSVGAVKVRQPINTRSDKFCEVIPILVFPVS